MKREIVCADDWLGVGFGEGYGRYRDEYVGYGFCVLYWYLLWCSVWVVFAGVPTTVVFISFRVRTNGAVLSTRVGHHVPPPILGPEVAKMVKMVKVVKVGCHHHLPHYCGAYCNVRGCSGPEYV